MLKKYFLFLIVKRKLNSDGNHFHQYQQNNQLPLIFTELTEHKKTMILEIHVLAWDRHIKVAKLID